MGSEESCGACVKGSVAEILAHPEEERCLEQPRLRDVGLADNTTQKTGPSASMDWLRPDDVYGEVSQRASEGQDTHMQVIPQLPVSVAHILPRDALVA